MRRLLPLLLVCCVPFAVAQSPDFPKIVDTQNPKDKPPTPEETRKLVKVPDGFEVTLFAGEPDVHQPIAMTLDDRGRLWVAECYTYDGRGWDPKARDRLVVLEDTDNDGRFDKRTIFWDKGRNLSSVAIGFGGVWVLCAPHLLFIPDNHGVAGEAQVVLDGWSTGASHNIVNGLTWGPDGWLYGRHGILDTSYPGIPGTAKKDRVAINTGIWRYHPQRKVVEAVCHGTTNPWGLDYDDHGHMFFTNNVIGHLWHVIPGAHYKRMYGEDLRRHVYELIDQHAEHYHWDTGKSWTDSRDAKGKNDELGGGHSHVGGMIYLGDNWPEKYRGNIFMCNTHGRRVNNDKLVRKGSGFAGQRNPDFLFVGTPWFRGISLIYGPDGGVYLSDWCDLGECHDNDGVHRTSGRVFKVTYGKAKAPAIKDVSKLSDAELVGLQLHKNDWYVRVARRLLQERHGDPAAKSTPERARLHESLKKMFAEQTDDTRRLRALWALHVTQGTPRAFLHWCLVDASEHVRSWAIKLLVDGQHFDAETLGKFHTVAENDPSALVRLHLASALQRLPKAAVEPLAGRLLAHAEDAADHNLPLLLWYGVEPIAVEGAGLRLAEASKIPLVRRLIARRLTEWDQTTASLDSLLAVATTTEDAARQRDILNGIADGLRGRLKADAPQSWPAAAKKLAGSADEVVKARVLELGVVFADGRAFAELSKLASDGKADPEARRTALKVLTANRSPELLALLKKLAGDRALVGVAVAGLAAYDDPAIPGLVVQNWRFLRAEEYPAAVATLCSRPAFARALLKAVADGKIPRTEITAFHARQIHGFGDDALNRELAKVWGEVRVSAKEKTEQIAVYKKLLTPARLKEANLSRGRLLFDQSCATCHVLYGVGKSIGPELTGSNRDNLDYLLENIVDPSAVLAADFKMSVVTLKNGRVITGVVMEPTERTIAVQTQTERLKLDREEIAEMRVTPQSLMPEGLLARLDEGQVRDLIAYLMHRQQVPLPAK